MPPWTPKYSDDEKAACVAAYLDRGIRPARRIAELGARGELQHNGRNLPAFTIDAQYISHLCGIERRKRAGRTQSRVADKPHRDAIDILRKRCIAAADALLADYEKQVKRKPETASVKRLMDILAVLTRAAAMPTKDDPRPATPGQRIPGTGDHAPKAGGALAGQILDAARRTAVYTPSGDDPRPDPPTEQGMAENTSAAGTEGADEGGENGTDALPGGAAREHVTRLAEMVRAS